MNQAVGFFTFRVAYDTPPPGIPFASLLGPLRPFGAPFVVLKESKDASSSRGPNGVKSLLQRLRPVKLGR